MWLSYVSVVSSLPCLVMSLYRWRVARMIADTPTSPVQSAAQGFVELKGKATRLGDRQIFVPVLQKACVWFRHEAYEREREGHDDLIDVRESFQRFYVDDGTGTCAIDPRQADILPTRNETRYEGTTVHKLSWIAPNDHIYVMGWLHTLHPRPKVNDVIRSSNAARTAGKPEKRYGQLKDAMHRVGAAPIPGIPFLIGAHGERVILKRVRRQALSWLLAFFSFSMLLPFLIEFHALAR